MGHSQADGFVGVTQRENLFTESSQAESVILALIVEVDLKILVDYRHQGGVLHVDIAFRILRLDPKLVDRISFILVVEGGVIFRRDSDPQLVSRCCRSSGPGFSRSDPLVSFCRCL